MNSLPKLALSDMQDLYSMAFVKAIVASAGYNYSCLERDRTSSDLNIEISDTSGYELAYDRLVVQVKCTYSHLINQDGNIHFPLPIKNYNDLRTGINPKILVVVLVPRSDITPVIPWIECNNEHTIFRYKAYWKSIHDFPPTENRESVTVLVPIKNVFDVETVNKLVDRMAVQGNKE